MKNIHSLKSILSLNSSETENLCLCNDSFLANKSSFGHVLKFNDSACKYTSNSLMGISFTFFCVSKFKFSGLASLLISFYKANLILIELMLMDFFGNRQV